MDVHSQCISWSIQTCVKLTMLKKCVENIIQRIRKSCDLYRVGDICGSTRGRVDDPGLTRRLIPLFHLITNYRFQVGRRFSDVDTIPRAIWARAAPFWDFVCD